MSKLTTPIRGRRRRLPSVARVGEPLVSVGSYGSSFEKTTMYGPYMPATGQARSLYDSLR